MFLRASVQRTMMSAANRARRPLLATAAAVGVAQGIYSFNSLAENASSEKIDVHIRYFDVEGVAEVIRHLMALSSNPWTEEKWGIDMKKLPDVAAASPGFAAARDSGNLDQNLGRAPVVLVTEGGKKLELGQSKAIERFLARRFGLLGEDEHEAAQIDAITEHIRDIKDKYQKAKVNPQDKAHFFDEVFPGFMEKVDMAIRDIGGGSGGGPALVGRYLSLADVVLFVMVRDFFDDKAAVEKTIKRCPRLQRSVEEVDAHPGIASYRAGKKTKK